MLASAAMMMADELSTPATVEDANPARYWRDVLMARTLRGNPPRPGVDPAAHFRALLDGTFAAAQHGLTRGTPRARAAAAPALFLAGLGLLTFGRLDVLPYVLTYIPAQTSPLRALASSISALLPLPPWLSPRANPAAVLAWLEARWEELRWSEADGRFVLDARAA